MNLHMSVLLLLVISAATTGGEVEIPREHHPWGRSEPGSWTCIREHVEASKGDQTTTHINEVTTTLVKVHVDGFELKRDVKSGDRVREGKVKRYRWDGTHVLDDAARDKLKKANNPVREQPVKFSLGEVDVDGSTHACQTHEREGGDVFAARIVKSWYSPDQSPFFLKRLERVTGKFPELTVMRVTKLNSSIDVLGKQLVGWESETLHSGPTIKWNMTSFHSMDIPGGLVSSEKVRTDSRQGIKMTIKHEVVAFEAKSPEERNN